MKNIEHWMILLISRDFVERIRSFMVIGSDGEGVVMATRDGEGYWLGKMKFGEETRRALEPTRLGVSKLARMAQGNNHIVLLNEFGKLYSMGENDWGQLGMKSIDNQIYFTPMMISNPSIFTDVRCGIDHSLALSSDGKVWAWGRNDSGEIGIHSSTSRLASLQNISKLDSHHVVKIDCGAWHSLALTEDGDVYAWGWNQWGQLGHNNSDKAVSDKQMHIPVRMSTTCPIKSIAAGDSHTLLLTLSGDVYSCGCNTHGQLGLSKNNDANFILRKVSGLPAISEIASHHNTNRSIAYSVDHECFVWGYLTSSFNVHIPLKLSPGYSTIESAFSFGNDQRNTPYSVRVQG